MASYTVIACAYDWWQGDPVPELSQLAGFRAAPANDYPLLARLVRVDVAEVERRVAQGSQPYVAWIGEVPVAYGWSASGRYEVPGSGEEISLEPEERMLWDFATLPEYRGWGIYPRLLQAILCLEAPAASRFTIGHAGDNSASQSGIVKAGFKLLARLVVTADGQERAILVGAPERAALSPFRSMVQRMPVEQGGLETVEAA